MRRGKKHQQLLQEQNFGEQFSVKDLVEALRRVFEEQARAQEREEAGATQQDDGLAPEFNPLPFMRAFEDAVADLVVMESQMERRIREATEKCGEAEEDYQRKLALLEQAASTFSEKLTKIDSRMSSITRSTATVGNRLANASSQRDTVEEAIEVMQYFQEFLQGSISSPLFVDPERIHERAAVLKTLRTIAAGLSHKLSEHSERASALVEERCRLTEKELLEEFCGATRLSDPRKMRTLAQTLFEFNGGASCSEAYVDTVFSSRVGAHSFRSGGGDLKAARSAVKKFFILLCNSVQTERTTIMNVFPDPSVVLSMLVRMIFASGGEEQKFALNVYGFIRRIEASMGSSVLEVLGDCYDGVTSLADIVKSYTFDSSINLQAMQAELFAEAMQSYIQRELERCKKVFSALINKSNGLLAAHTNVADVVDMDEARELSMADLETTKFLIKECLTAVIRCTKLSAPKDVPRNIIEIYRLLLGFLGTKYLLTGLERHVALVPDKGHAKRPLRVTFLTVVLAVNTIVIDVENFHHNEVLPRIHTVNEPAKCTQMKSAVTGQAEALLSKGLQILLRAIADQGSKLLASHSRRADYRQTDVTFTGEVNAGVRMYAAFLSRQHLRISSSLDGKNLETFLRRLGGRMLADLFDNYIVPANVNVGLGGTQLIVDLSCISDAVKRWGIPELNERMDVLRKMANIHTMEESKLGDFLKQLRQTVSRADLVKYLPSHEHYKSAWLETLLP